MSWSIELLARLSLTAVFLVSAGSTSTDLLSRVIFFPLTNARAPSNRSRAAETLCAAAAASQ